MRWIALTFILTLIFNLQAQEWNQLVDLRGHWKFEIGDNSKWADANFDDSKWQEIFVPSPWEDEGFPGYDGYAWYRTRFRISSENKGKAIYLRLGRIDDVDEVYLNGHFVAFSGMFPPEYSTAYNFEREYFIPQDYLNFSGTNVLAVRIYDDEMAGGIVEGKIGLYEKKDYLYPDINLDNSWKFRTGDDMEWKEENYDDGSWHSIRVPAYWETQGYKDYDGFGWYRKKFSISSKYRGEELILLLGRIDDLDEVYLNGNRIGKTGRIYEDTRRISLDDNYIQSRAYYIPENDLHFNGENTLAVRVYDGYAHGGIYDGPIGIVLQDRYLAWQKEYQKSNEKKFRSIFDVLFPDKDN